MNMDKISEILKKKQAIVNNVNNDSKDFLNNDNNGSYKSKYALDKSKFMPNTEQTQLAEKIAVALNDTNNYACYLSVVNKIGATEGERLFRSVLSDIEEKRKTKCPVRSKARYFMWKFKDKRY